MEYPSHLLPQKSYKIIDFDNANLSLEYLIRHTNTTDIEDIHGNLKDELIVAQNDHLRDFSTNLLGVFQVDDLQWNCFNIHCNELWAMDQDPFYPSDLDVEKVNTQRGCFYLKISSFHQISFSTKDEQEGEQLIICRVAHTPVKSNFWHCSLRWFCNEQESRTWNKGRMKRMKATIRSFISHKAELTEPNYQAINPECYIA